MEPEQINSNQTNKRGILLIIIVIIILMAGTSGYFIYNGREKPPSLNNPPAENKQDNNEVNQNTISLVPLKQGKTEKIEQAELLPINNYKLIIPSGLVNIGYNLVIDNNVLTITAQDNSQKFILLQLTDNYIEISEADIDKYHESTEYQNWEKDYYNSDNADNETLLQKKDELQLSYYRSIGYTVRNTPDMDWDKLSQVVGKYILAGESHSAGYNGLFPGYEAYINYDWGRRIRYAIPKVDPNDSTKIANFSVYLETFHYYDNDLDQAEIDLWLQ